MESLEGLRVLAVEDEPLLLLDLQDMLAELRCDVVAAAARVDRALHLAGQAEFDIAVLDVNLGGATIDEVAGIIAGRGLPLLFVTGYGRNADLDRLPGPVVSKPLDRTQLRDGLRRALQASACAEPARG
jgi:CheY-like chemotaxis protein